MKTRILAMNPTKLLQTATSTTKLTHSIRIRLARLVRSCFIKNAPRFARGSNNTIYGDRNILLPLPGNVDVEEKYVDKKIIKKEKGKKKG